jgi:hypothetical protein
MVNLRALTNQSLSVGAGIALLILGSTATTALAQSGTISACVNRGTGAMKIIKAGEKCPRTADLLIWNQSGIQGPVGPQGPAGAPGVPGPQGQGTMANVQYVWAYEFYTGTNVARAICPANTVLTGGGGFSVSGVGLQQDFPISDLTGTFAWDGNGVGWQVAATDFSLVHAFAVCMEP